MASKAKRRKRFDIRPRLGWSPDLPDQRDFVYQAPRSIVKALPPSTDLRDTCSPVDDQDQLGACVADGVCSAHQFQQNKQKRKNAFKPSRLFVYYFGRQLEGTTSYDSGLYVRDGIKILARMGVCSETTVPYDITKYKQKPSQAATREAGANQISQYDRVPRVMSQFKGCLASGYSFVFGFSVYESFESDAVWKTGLVPMPKIGETLLGGHCVEVVGYSDSRQCMLCKNSWGTDWGLDGYFWMPYEYFLNSNLSDDFWRINMIER